MDKETLSNYGWIVICVLVLAVMIALATPFGKFVGDGFKSTYEGLYHTMTKGLSVIQVTEEMQTDPALNHKNIIPEGGTYYVNYRFDNSTYSFIWDNEYNSGEPFPTAQPGDLYRYGNYEYCYGFDFCCDRWSMDCCDITISGWAVRCIVDTANPGPILNSINDIDDIIIASYAFYETISLEIFEIKSSVKEIREHAFVGTALETVNLSGCNELTTIGTGVFYNCTSLESITLPDSLTTIGDTAFDNCTSLESITIPNSVTTIGRGAFNSCSSLTSITIPNSVTTIGGSTFFQCPSLKAINVDNNNQDYCSVDGVLYTKDMTTFIQYPTGKTEATYAIPNSVTAIDNYAFFQCPSLTSITIPEGVTTIGEHAFSYCESLESITLPDSLTTIGDSTFVQCPSLTSITFDGTIAQWNAITKGFNWNHEVPTTYVQCSDGQVPLS